MKYFITLAVAAIVMSSCIAVKNSGEDRGANSAAATFTVSIAQWQYREDADGLNGFFYCPQQWSKLSSSLLGSAVIVAYVKIDGRYQQLPYTIYRENIEHQQWAEHIDYDYSAGEVVFYVTYSDFYNEYKPREMEFRVIMMW